MARPDFAITTREIEDAFAEVLRDEIFGGEDFVLIEPYNGPRPKAAYSTIHLLSGQGYQHEIRRYYVNEDGEYTESILGTEWCRMIIQFYGGDAFGSGVKARNKFKSASREFDLFRKIGFGQISEVMSIPTEYQAKIEPRARLTVDFYATIYDENAATDIGKVHGTINGGIPFEVNYPEQ